MMRSVNVAAQLDLFPPPPAYDEHAQARGWERRALRDMEHGPLTYCFPGFMGAVCETLVERGLAVRESAGFLAPDLPQFAYGLRAGR